MTVHYEDMRGLERNFKEIGVIYETNTDRNPNIVSSYCGEDVFRTGQWLVANEYHSVLDSFDFEPLLKINISDSNQSFTPFFAKHTQVLYLRLSHISGTCMYGSSKAI
ncbi:hypothetical protein PEC18_30830 [Paucibacter sp. O1-1]|nr:hypothetical protein [Paucibacter sp. O1-1]MDA3830103.1 hypothetical protein [Paucibacter sp. O1-1]